MNTSRTLTWVSLSLVCSMAIVACDKSGPAETLGKNIDDKTEKMSETIDQAATAMSEKGAQTASVIDDATITAKVKSAILAETGLRVLQVKVETVDGVVTLVGSADSQQNIDKAKELAKAVEGVKDVENRLALESPN